MNQINTATAALNRAIISSINGSGLPPCVVGLVLDKLRAEVSALEAQAILREQEAAKAETEQETTKTAAEQEAEE